MTKKVVIGFFFSVFLTVVLWQVTARLSFGRALDDIVFMQAQSWRSSFPYCLSGRS
ncbi:hypothetical protein RFM23_19460 [Mesorhizobium abyssinicae]|uniref:Uncharacterized protein n=1 Tax=Mesorhizobium abyssinicae TaxID=1209958 RepID=A0ABU5AR70_9HYPH|nr:hypothetical protein [Mesorhizobium abyssinicae]MDX8539802.1 hypothetical protein [Mesorhizobium abyssinicae]